MMAKVKVLNDARLIIAGFDFIIHLNFISIIDFCGKLKIHAN